MRGMGRDKDSSRRPLARGGRKKTVTTWRKTVPNAETMARGGKKNRSRALEPAKPTKNRASIASINHWQSLWHLHRRIGRESLARLLATPTASLMTVLVLAIALALPTTFSLTLDNLKTAVNGSNITTARIALYLNAQVDDKAARLIMEQLVENRDVISASYISPQQGLAEFKQYSGFGEALRLLDNNPLPGVIEVEPRDTSAQLIQRLQDMLETVEGVEQIQVDNEWLRRLNAIVALGDRLLTGLSILIALTIVLVVGNTIRLLVVNRRDEIRVLKLVGGSDSFVILPFLYSGLWYGLAGAIVCWLIVIGLWLATAGPTAELAALYQSSFRLKLPGVSMTLVLVASGAFMGVSGALLSSWRQLRDIDP